MEITNTIPVANLPYLYERITQANKKASKYNIDPIKVVEGTHFTRTRSENGFQVEYQAVEVTLIGDTPKYAGWSFVSSMELGENGAVIRSLPGMECPADQRNRGNVCDYCGHKRERSHTFVLVHDNGEVKQVGRQCLKAFMGEARFDPNQIAYRFQFLVELGKGIGEDEWGDSVWGGGSTVDPRYTLTNVLELTGAVIKKEGWVSGGEAKNNWDLTSTASRVGGVLGYRRDHKYPDYKYEAWRNLVLEDAKAETRKQEAEEAIEWLLAQPTQNDYIHTCQIIAKDGWVDGKRFGFACSILTSFRKAMSREIERAQRIAQEKVTSQYVGEIKQRLTLQVNVLSVKVNQGIEFTSYIHNMVDDQGNKLVWFASTGTLEVGQHTIKATVVKHSEYQGVKQTVVNRVKEVD